MKKISAVLFSCALVALFFAPPVSPAEILIDPGHSPGSPGAIGCSGTREHLYNEALASRIAIHLQAQGFKVSLTRARDSDLSTARRTFNSKGKDLFLSIHHDSVQPQFITLNAKGGFCSSKARGFSIFVSRNNRHFKESLRRAQRLGAALVRKGLNPTHHHAEKINGESRHLHDPELGVYFFDELTVLKYAECPAILFEAAVIVNPLDEAQAVSKDYQLSILESIEDMLRSK